MHVDMSSTGSALESEVENLRRALETRTQIGIALGILTERYGCTSPQAWTLLTRLSSHTNIKVVEIARALVASADGTADEHDVTTLGELTAHLPRRTNAAIDGHASDHARRRQNGRTVVRAGDTVPAVDGSRGTPRSWLSGETT